jgi:hypothetical protein
MMGTPIRLQWQKNEVASPSVHILAKTAEWSADRLWTPLVLKKWFPVAKQRLKETALSMDMRLIKNVAVWQFIRFD